MNWCQLLHHLSWRQLSKNSTIHFVQNLPSIKLHSDLRYNWSSSQSACGKTLQLEKVLQVLFLADQFPWADLWQWCTIGPCSVFLRQFFTQVATYLSSNRFVVWRRSHKGSASCCLVNQSQAQPSWQPRVVRCCFLGFFWGFFFFFFQQNEQQRIQLSGNSKWQLIVHTRGSLHSNMYSTGFSHPIILIYIITSWPFRDEKAIVWNQ